ncbi:hypothetical protein [Sodalinema gerasimenkoae]|uniref:hypothetical protein n=1 Tax=Sodalinema gerasimenkoae TaxID=2862348 RepID=UPI00135994AF|nr:hypothetical protein [Sodalinema gerasimenkoae]
MQVLTTSTKALLMLGVLVTLTTSAIACAPMPDAGTPSFSEETKDSDPVSVGEANNGEEATVDEILTPAVQDRILQTVAIEVDRPLEELRIAAAETATFDGCMGIYEPDQICTMIAIFGLRVVVTDGDQSWVYHTPQNGEGAVQNPTASGSRNGLIPDFIPEPVSETEPDLEDHIFRSVESGGRGGYSKTTVLLEDGRLLQKENGTVTAEAHLSSEELEAFQQVLETQRFPNLHRLRYVTDAAFSDHPTVRLSVRHLETEYIDLALDDAPEALQVIVQAWEDTKKIPR